ncbi:MAG: hypothetical protein ABI874_13615, partial [Chloroflexota bacterium]
MPRSTYFLILLALAAFVAVYQPHQTFSVDLAADSADKFLDNFHAPERGYRWSQARSAVWLSGLGGGNLAWTVDVRLSGSRPAGIAAPHVTIRVNGQPRGEFVATNEERDVEFVIGPWQLGANGDLRLEIDADTFTLPNDPRELGVRVLRVWVTPFPYLALPSLKVFVFLLAIAIAGMFIARSLRVQLPTSNFQPPISNLQSPNLILCIIIALIFSLALNRAEAAWWIIVIALCALGVAALLALVAWIVPRERMTKRQWNVLLIVFVVAALVRLALDTGRGYEGDVAIYLSLAWKTVTYGIHSAYLNVSDVPPPNTPPLLLYPLWLMGWLYQQIFSPLFPPTWLNDPPILRFMLRLPSLAADVLIAAIICRITAQSEQSTVNSEPSTVNRSPFTVHRSLLTALYLFNPAVIFDSAYWGQTAAIHTLWMLLA